MDEIKAKQQVVEKIKEAGKILVTVSDNPSVDALSAALGLTLLLDKQEKYATSIFSGETPPAIAFLEPEKTFDDTTDSLRDFIIALNKEKADHLRYKVEGDAVKIFITPYKTTITQSDLEFSQGDYNVELVIALGVNDQEHLDKALENHGQILHDATIVTLTAGDQMSSLGGIDWHDSNASSLSEMVTGLVEALKEDKKKSLLDNSIATALLTGIVAETDRFSNEHTTSKVMTVAASLMAAGADQQLIANELQQARSIQVTSDDDTSSNDEPDEPSSEGGASDGGEAEEPKDKTILAIEHDETLAELDKRVRGEERAKEKIEEEIEAIEEEAEEEAEKRQKEAIAESRPDIIERPMAIESPEAPEQSEVIEQPADVDVEPPVQNTTGTAYALDDEAADEPTFGGILNATADQAEEDARREELSDQNKTILAHAYIGEPAAEVAASTSGLTNTTPVGFPGTPQVAPGSQGVNDFGTPDADSLHSAYAPEEAHEGSVGIGGERVIQPLGDINQPAPNPLEEVLKEETALPGIGAAPTDLGLPLPPPLPDFSQGATLPPVLPLPPTDQPEILGDILAPETAQPMSYEMTNAIPAPGSAYAFDATSAIPPVEQVVTEPASDTLAPEPLQSAAPPSATPVSVAPSPGQFQIPGQS